MGLLVPDFNGSPRRSPVTARLPFRPCHLRKRASRGRVYGLRVDRKSARSVAGSLAPALKLRCLLFRADPRTLCWAFYVTWAICSRGLSVA